MGGGTVAAEKGYDFGSTHLFFCVKERTDCVDNCGHFLFLHMCLAQMLQKGHIWSEVGRESWWKPAKADCPFCFLVVYTNRDLTYTTRQGSRVSCVAQTGFAAFGNSMSAYG